MQNTPYFLIFGGTNFMGKSMVDHLSTCYPNAEIYLINRGKKYWNNEVFKQNPKVKFFYGDRNQHKQMHKAVQYLNSKLQISQTNPWTAVIDYTSYKWRDLQSVTRVLKGKTELYIFISTDSIYNNTPFAGVPITEESLPIEQLYKQQRGKKNEDKYGYDKLKCEIYLKRKHPVPFINLRLPDVLGPYQNTNRYWCLLQWIKNCDKYPLQMNQKDVNSKLSFVYSKDISQFISKLIDRREIIDKYRSYNISFNESLTYKQLAEMMAKSLRNPVGLKIKSVKKQETTGLFPSTSYTCISNELAKRQLGWSPTSIMQCIQQSTKFFQEKGHLYENEQREMRKQFNRKVVNQD